MAYCKPFISVLGTPEMDGPKIDQIIQHLNRPYGAKCHFTEIFFIPRCRINSTDASSAWNYFVIIAVYHP